MKHSYLTSWGSSIVNGLLHIPPDAGGAGGVADAGSASLGAGASSGGGAGGTQAFRLSDDALVDFGDGRGVSWKDATSGPNSRYMTRESFNRGVEFLTNEAKRLDDLQFQLTGQRGRLQQPQNQPQQQQFPGRGMHQQTPPPRQQQQLQQNQPQPPQQRDMFGHVRGRAVIDGDTLAQIGDTLYREGFGPIAQVLAQMNSQNQELRQALDGLRQEFQPHAEARARGDFERTIGTVLSGITGVKGMPEGITLDLAKYPALKELYEDMYSSYDNWTPGSEAKMFKERLEAMFSMVRAMDRDALAKAEEIRRGKVFPDIARGGARPTGNAPYRFQSGRDVAAMASEAGLFRGRSAA